MKAAPNVTVLSSNFTQYRYNSIYGRFNYTFDEKYILNVTGRRDGSSRFGPDKRFASFGAVGAAWVFSKETYLSKKISFLSFGKLRASYGTTGNDRIGDYEYLDSYTPSQYPYDGTGGLIPTRLANQDYSWETNKKLEAAVELGFIKNRIQFAASWYRNRSSNQLVGFSLPLITGRPSIQFNLPATVENNGWELELKTINIETSNFQWTAGFNISIPENKLVEYEGLDKSPYATKYALGKSLYTLFTLHSTGIDPTTGFYSFEDLNEDGEITFPEDYAFRREMGQKYFGGFQNSLSFCGLQFDLLVQFVKQTGQSYLSSFISQPGSPSNQPHIIFDGGLHKVQKFTWFNPESYNNATQSDLSITDASFIRIKNASLSYSLSGGWLQRAKVQHAKVYVKGQNLFTISNYLGLDPESQDSRRLPPLRFVTLGLQITL